LVHRPVRLCRTLQIAVIRKSPVHNPSGLAANHSCGILQRLQQEGWKLPLHSRSTTTKLFIKGCAKPFETTAEKSPDRESIPAERYTRIAFSAQLPAHLVQLQRTGTLPRPSSRPPAVRPSRHLNAGSTTKQHLQQ